jgi:hypothetical protein
MDLNSITAICRPGGRDEFQPWRTGDAWLAGGTWLFSEPQPDLLRLIDLARLGWPAMEIDPDGLRIGATCTLAQLAAADLPTEWLPAPLFGSVAARCSDRSRSGTPRRWAAICAWRCQPVRWRH